MSLYTIVTKETRPKMLQWLHENTTIKLSASGADLWPFEEITKITRDTVIRASNKGISIEWPLNGQIKGKRFDNRQFCKMIKDKFPPRREWKQEGLF